MAVLVLEAVLFAPMAVSKIGITTVKHYYTIERPSYAIFRGSVNF
jgi:hypothetical protein